MALVYVIYDQISTPINFDDELKAKKAQDVYKRQALHGADARHR